MQIKNSCLLILIVFTLSLVSYSANDCVLRRGALDLGSGTTKIMIADIDVCNHKIQEIIFSDSLKLDYQEELQKNGSHRFGPAMQFRFITETLRFFRTAVSFAGDKTEWFGGATAAFRQAENAHVYLNRLSGFLGFNIRVLSVEEEAEKTFRAICASVSAESENIISWEIGSGSTQLGTLDDRGAFVLYSAPVASVTFKNMVIEKILRRDPRVFQSPNPMTEAALLSAVELAAFQTKTVPDIIRQKIAAENTIIMGTGGVHLYSVQPRVERSNFYTQADLLALLKKNTSVEDKDLGGPFASTQITNMALVYGFMRELGVERVDTIKTGLLQGILLYPPQP